MSYLPDMSGRYTITIKYGGDEIPYSPFRIHALPTGDASKCLVTGGRPSPPYTPHPSPLLILNTAAYAFLYFQCPLEATA